MKLKVLTFSILLSLTSAISAQNFMELCANASTTGTVVDFEWHEGQLYATGFFQQICGETGNFMARWENETWVPAPFSLSDPGHSLRSINGQLYVARYEESIDSNWVYVYDGNTLNKLGTGVYLTTASGFSQLPNIYDIVEFNGQLVACGEFDRVGSQSISNIMQWNGNDWEAMGTGLTGNIPNTPPIRFPHQLLVHDDALYVVGNFQMAGGIVVNGIGKWDGNQWSAMGDGFNNTVYGIGVYENEIYVGGAFTQSGTKMLNRLAKWNGSEWVSPGFGFTLVNSNDFAFVHTLQEIDDVFYLLGGLKQLTYDDGSTESCGGIVAYEGGAVVNTFNGGVSGYDLEAVAKDGTQLLVGGGVFGSGYLGISSTTTSAQHSLNLSEELHAYPNPFTDQLNIQSSSPILRWQIIHQSGKILQEATGSATILDLSDLPAGLYFIQVETEAGKLSQKLIKRRSY